MRNKIQSLELNLIDLEKTIANASNIDVASIDQAKRDLECLQNITKRLEIATIYFMGMIKKAQYLEKINKGEQIYV